MFELHVDHKLTDGADRLPVLQQPRYELKVSNRGFLGMPFAKGTGQEVLDQMTTMRNELDILINHLTGIIDREIDFE